MPYDSEKKYRDEVICTCLKEKECDCEDLVSDPATGPAQSEGERQ